MSGFEVGRSVVRRDVLRGRVWTAEPRRVISDDGYGLLLACWPGVRSLEPTTFVDWLVTGDEEVRKQGIPNMAAGKWELTEWVWRDTNLLAWYGVDPGFSVQRFFGTDGRALRWYVNFERPMVRTAHGIDTFDLLLDLVAAPDLSEWHWKDRDEYELGRRLGVITDDDDYAVREASERAIAMLEARRGPFAREWATWRPQPEWPAPRLTEGSTGV